MPTMRRMVLWSACAAALVGCNLDVGNPNLERLLVTPILDSLFVGDTVTLLKIAYYNDHGDSVTPPAIRWSSGTPAVASVDSVTGKLTAVGPRSEEHTSELQSP